MFGIREPFTLLFDDVIEASLMFKSDFANTKRAYSGFLLYFIGKSSRNDSRESTIDCSFSHTHSWSSTLDHQHGADEHNERRSP